MIANEWVFSVYCKYEAVIIWKLALKNNWENVAKIGNCNIYVETHFPINDICFSVWIDR